MYVILKLLFNENLLFGYYRKKTKYFWSILRLILLTRQFGGVNSSEASQVCHKEVDGSSYLRNIDK